MFQQIKETAAKSKFYRKQTRKPAESISTVQNLDQARIVIFCRRKKKK